MINKISQLAIKNLQIQKGLYNFSNGVHFRSGKNESNKQNKLQAIKDHNKNAFQHPVWSDEEVKDCKIDIKETKTIGDRFAFYSIQCLRSTFDFFSGYTRVLPWQGKEVSETIWINRVLFLETIAGIPGFVGAMFRHLRSLTKLKRDNGWIHTLLEEAENERFHLVTFLKFKKPGPIFKLFVIGGQVVWTIVYGAIYMILPRVAHRMVGHLEEQAVITYTHLIQEINREGSSVHRWKTVPAPEYGIKYWKLKKDATMLDLIYAVRKDEEHHKEVNHELGDDYTQSMPNPYPPGM